MSEEFIHAPVMVREVVAALQIKSGGNYIDATFGRGGHSAALLAAMDVSARLLALDQDPQAIAFGRQQYANEPRISFMQKNFSAIDTCANEVFGSGPQVDGIVFDLGVSSPQLDDAQRGFAFLRDGPLDMRMDLAGDMSAADWLQHVDEAELVQVLFRYGEERYARRIAAAIVRARGEQAITRTGQLAEIVSTAVPKREPGKHPATRTFQAIRICINQELENISSALPKALSVLKPRGRLAVISFHSLEDRIVKRYFREQGRGDPYPVDLPVPADQLAPQLKLVGKAQRPTPAELAANPRARSAVLRVAEKVEAAHA